MTLNPFVEAGSFKSGNYRTAHIITIDQVNFTNLPESYELIHTKNTRSMIIDPIEDQLGISTYLVANRRREGSMSLQINNVNADVVVEDDTNPREDHDCTNHGFSAISKARFSDFIVHEGTSILVGSP